MVCSLWFLIQAARQKIGTAAQKEQQTINYKQQTSYKWFVVCGSLISGCPIKIGTAAQKEQQTINYKQQTSYKWFVVCGFLIQAAL
jgi:hypothetical protein